MIAAFVLAGVGARAKELPYQGLDYVRAVRNMDMYANRTEDAFAAELAVQYKSLALFKSVVRRDSEGANHFARKAILAYHGDRIRPDTIYNRGIPMGAITEISNAYDDMTRFLATSLRETYPQLVAEGQAKLDCWSDSLSRGESARQTDECRGRFMKARDMMLAKLEEDCNSSCEVAAKPEPAKKPTIRLFNGELPPIPKWPANSLIANKPPKPSMMKWNSGDSIAIAEAQGEIGMLRAALARIEAELAKVREDQATKDGTDSIMAQIAALDERVESLKDNGSEDIMAQLDSISSQLDDMAGRLNSPSSCGCAAEASCPPCAAETITIERQPEPDYKFVEPDDYIEEEIFDRPSDLLPFEIFFDWDKDNVDYKFLPQIRDITEKALLSKESIIIRGHTDTSGTKAHNLDLSRRRALNVAKVLEDSGIDSDKIVIEAMGEADLKVQTPPGVKKPENRRAVIQ
ncbi:MAG: OmpA family protein [Rickettsiales bacterium]|nr:OmpA family protein [Rickettsiales bacterium]